MSSINGIEAVELLGTADPAAAHAVRQRGRQPVVERTAAQPLTINGIRGVIFGTAASGPGATIRLDSADPALALAARQRGQHPLVVVNSSGAVVAATPAAPVNTSVPTISGTATQGETLYASEGVWTGSPAPVITYQWQADTAGNGSYANIGGATANTFLLTASEVGDKVRVVTTGTNASGSASANSLPTTLVASSGGLAAPVLTWDGETGDATPEFTVDLDDAITSGTLTLQIDDNNTFPSPDAYTATINSAAFSTGSLTLTPSMATYANGTYYARCKVDSGAWSNIQTVTISAAPTNVITNGTFATDTDWTKGTGVTIAGGVATAVNAGSIVRQVSVLTNGVDYDFSFDWDYTGASGLARLRIENGTPGNGIVWTSAPLLGLGGAGTATGSFTAAGTTFAIAADSWSYDGTIDNIVVTAA